MNDHNEEVMHCKGCQEGEVVVYNQKVELGECNLSEVEKLRF